LRNFVCSVYAIVCSHSKGKIISYRDIVLDMVGVFGNNLAKNNPKETFQRKIPHLIKLKAEIKVYSLRNLKYVFISSLIITMKTLGAI